MDQGWATRINLIEFLEEQHPEAPLLPDDTASYWDEAQIRAYFQLPQAGDDDRCTSGHSDESKTQPAVPSTNSQIADFNSGSTAIMCTAAPEENPYLWPGESDELEAGSGRQSDHGLCIEPEPSDCAGKITDLLSAPLGPAVSIDIKPFAAVAPTVLVASSPLAKTVQDVQQLCTGNGSKSTDDLGVSDSARSSNEAPRQQDVLATGHSGKQPGGGRLQPDQQHLDPAAAPSNLRAQQLAATVEGYRIAVYAHGIPYRPNGLFPPGDPLLAELAARPQCRPFEKHMAGAAGPHLPCPLGGWTTGDSACRAGFDLRMFHQEAVTGERWGTLVAAARLGEGASIGAGCWVTAHGGAVESLLDEATAELAKLEWAPVLATIELANFSIKKAVPLRTTLRITCQIRRVNNVRCWVAGTVTDATGVLVYASCEAQLVDLAALLRGG